MSVDSVVTHTKSVARALAILQAFRPDRPSASLSELARAVQIDKATVRRLLVTMQHHGFIDQDALSRQYRLGPAVLELGAAVKINRELRDVVRPVMFELANKTRLTAYVGVLSGDEALCVERVEGSSPVQVRMWLSGSRMALNCGAGPRVLLAHLNEPRIQEIVAGHLARITVKSQVNGKLLLRDLRRIRSRGWELAVDDVTIGAAAVGVPLRDRAGTVVAALSLAGLTQQMVQRGRPRFLTDMLAAARRISPQLHAP